MLRKRELATCKGRQFIISAAAVLALNVSAYASNPVFVATDPDTIAASAAYQANCGPIEHDKLEAMNEALNSGMVDRGAVILKSVSLAQNFQKLDKAAWCAKFALVFGNGGIDIVKGKFTEHDGIATQLLSLINHQPKPLRGLFVQCAFFRGDNLLGVNFGGAYNVNSGETAYMQITITDAADVNRTECRVDQVVP